MSGPGDDRAAFERALTEYRRVVVETEHGNHDPASCCCESDARDELLALYDRAARVSAGTEPQEDK